MNKNNYSLEVSVNGRPLKEYSKHDKCFIEGRENTRYTLKFRNNSWKKILAVFSVDGIEVIEGKVASEFKGGYVIDPYSSIEIKGYRIDESSVAAFRFAKSHKSYSNEVGGATVNEYTGETEYKKTTRNNGVIGVRVFEEKVKKIEPVTFAYTNHGNWGNGIIYSGLSPQTYNPLVYCSGMPSSALGVYQINQTSHTPQVVYATGCIQALTNIASTNCADAFVDPNQGWYNVTRGGVNQMGQLSVVPRQISSAPDFNLGTTWGETVADKVKEVKFEPSEEYTDLELYYDSRESLIGFGIDFEATKQYAAWPAAFSEKKKQFCKVPSNYKG